MFSDVRSCGLGTDVKAVDIYHLSRWDFGALRYAGFLRELPFYWCFLHHTFMPSKDLCSASSWHLVSSREPGGC